MNTRKARALISLGAESSKLGRDLNNAKKKLRGFGGDAKKLLGFGKKAAGMVLGGGLFGGGLAVAGGLGDLVGDLLGFEKNLVRFQIASGKSTAELNKLRTSIDGVSRDTGVARDQLLAGAQTYVDLTGDVAGAEKAMNAFARISQASGASVSDVATATAALQQSMGLDAGDIEAVFSGLITQGKKGAVSLKDFAGELSTLAPKFAKFGGGTGPAAIANLGAAFQAARQGFGSASEAATGLEALMGALAQNAKKFQASGVKIFNVGKDGKKTFRGFNEIVDAIGKSKLAKDPTLLAKAFGSKEAVQAYDMLSRNRDLLNELAEAGRDAGAVQRDLATYQASAAGKIEKAFNAAKLALAEAFTPERIEKFASALTKVLDTFVAIVDAVDTLMSGATPEDVIKEGRTKILTQSAAGDELTNRTDKIARAADLASASDARLAEGGFTREQRDEAVKRLLGEALDYSGLLSQGIAMQSGIDQGRTNAAVASVDRLQRQIVEALAKANITVKLDSSTVAKKVDNAPAHRKG